MLKSHQLSIIIPVLNEANSIENLLEHLSKNSSPENIREVLIVDGGSEDSTVSIVESNILNHDKIEFFGKISLLNSEKGRAKQLNHGARNSNGAILYFLHADSFPPPNFDKAILDEVQKGNRAGCFRMEFESSHWWLRLTGWLTKFCWKACRGGDQSQFIAKGLFDDIGGYNEDYIIYEDNILINELFKRKEFIVINQKLKTSARRYEKHGVWKLQYHFLRIYALQFFGASASDLLAYYKSHID